LSESNSPPEKSEIPRTGRRKFRIWIILGVLLLGIVWVDGPGFRWIAPRLVMHFLSRAGLRGEFQIEGRLSRGFSISALRIEGDLEMDHLKIGRLTPDYQLSELARGRLTSLSMDGLEVHLRSGVKGGKVVWPPDLRTWVERLHQARIRVIPLELDFQNVSVTVSRDSKPLLRVAPSRLLHRSGSDDFLVELGAITDATNREWPTQKATVAWERERIVVPRLDPFPGVALRDGVLQLPVGGEPLVTADLHLDDAIFEVASSSGMSAVRVILRDGTLAIGAVAKRFGIEIPAANLSSLSLEMANFFPNPMVATGTVHLMLEDGAWNDWQMPRLELDAVLMADQCSIAARGEMLGSEFSMDATAPVARREKRWLLGDAQGHFEIVDVPQLLRGLAKRLPQIEAEAKVPPSRVDGRFGVSFRENQPNIAFAELVLKPQDHTLASDITLKSRWKKNQPISADLALEGLTASATYQPQFATYQAAVELNGFDSRRIDRWLAAVKVKPVGAVSLTGKWSGSGELRSGTHRGDFSLAQGTWSREAAAPITAIGDVQYDWPATLETQRLRLQMNEQTVLLDAVIADHSLDFRHFLWRDGEQELASGRASLPLPNDLVNWRESLVKDARLLAVSARSQVLSLGLLKAWFPALEKIDPRSTGQVVVSVAGTYAEPQVDAKLELREIRSLAQPGLPPADVKITLAGRDSRLVLDGVATAPDFPAAVMTVAMAFHPSKWAKNPQYLKEEGIDGRLDFPRIDLSRFTSLLPGVEQISGIVTGDVVLAGTVGKPQAKGSLELAKASLRLKNGSIPAVVNVAASAEFALDRIVLKKLTGNVAGGSLQGGGALAVRDGKLGEVDLRFQGDHLLLKRNDLLILRANADLRLQGPWRQAKLSGTVGAVDSIFYRDIELLPIGKPFTTPRAAALPKIDTPRFAVSSLRGPYPNWALDVNVRTEESILIRGNFATGTINGSVRIGGTLGNPLPDGQFTLRDFRAALPFSTLFVRTGSATFTPATGFDPTLEISGTTSCRSYEVSAYVYGRASDPQLLLSSNPPLPENEIMTLLATGTTTSELESPQAASSQALQLLLEEVRRGRFRYGKRLRPVLALLDRVDFSLAEADPYSSESFSTATLSVTDRWFLSAGMGATGDTRLLAIWRLTFR
jgi:hypothetical protein